MDKIWRFYDGWVSGIVVADSEAEALERADEYLKARGFHEQLTPKLRVWPVTEDDYYDPKHPWAVTVSF